MATIGLRVQDSPLGGNLSLADTLAKSIFGDPESEMNARVKASQVGAHEAYRSKQLADAGLVDVKTAEEQARRGRTAARRAAGRRGCGGRGADAHPGRSLARRRAGDDGLWPAAGDRQPRRSGSITTRWWRASARSGRFYVRGNPNQVAEGVDKDYGGAIFAGATTNPAIVNPDSLRLASTLYTGSAPDHLHRDDHRRLRRRGRGGASRRSWKSAASRKSPMSSRSAAG